MKRVLSLFLPLSLALLLAGCGSNAAKAPVPIGSDPVTTEHGGYTVTDMLGNTVAFDRAPQRIVALQPSDVEILYALGAQDKLVGVGEYCNYPAEAQKKDVVSSGENTNVEQILALSPDLLILGTMAQTETQLTTLKNAGINVLRTDAKDIATTYVSIELLGLAAGCETEAGALVREMKAGFEELHAKAGDGTKSIYFEVSPLEYGLWTAGADTFMQELADCIGVKNAFADVSGWAEISEEQVLARNPDYISTVTMYYGEGPSPTAEILARTNWKDVAAVQTGAVFQADNDIMTRPGPRLVQGAQALYNFVYGG